MVDRTGLTAPSHTLDGDAWELCYAKRVDAAAVGYPAGLPGYATVPAVVPGAVELDLMRAGVLPDPFVGENLRQAWEFEYGDWWYRTSFDLPTGFDPTRTNLVFDGLDTIATVYLNGTEIGRAANMMIAHELKPGTSLRAGRNELVVHIESPLLAAEGFPYPAQLAQIWDASESLWIRKPPHMYGWDIAPRLVSAGIFRSVRLVERAPQRLVDWYLVTQRLDAANAQVELQYELAAAPRGRDVRLHVSGRQGERGFEATAYPTFRSGHLRFIIEDPQPWWPRSHGRPNLYDVELLLTVDGVEVDRHATRWGVRTIALESAAGRGGWSLPSEGQRRTGHRAGHELGAAGRPARSRP